MKTPAFGNSMEPDNKPDLAGNSDRASGDDRPVPDNGTKNASFSVGGLLHETKVSYPLPPDPHAPPGPDSGSGGDDEISDFGLNESVEVGFNGGVHDYGLSKGEAKQGGVEDSVSGQGFGSGKATGTSDTKE